MAVRHPPCRALKPKEKDYKVTDRDGMYVHVTAKGAMSFRMTEGPLPADVLTAIDDAALRAQLRWLGGTRRQHLEVGKDWTS
jgi:sulfite reductase beta subunit-like hemoprotein